MTIVADRKVYSRSCKGCGKEYITVYFNKTYCCRKCSRNVTNAAFKARHPKIFTEYNRRYLERHPEKRNYNWYKTHKAKRREYIKNNRAKINEQYNKKEKLRRQNPKYVERVNAIWREKYNTDSNFRLYCLTANHKRRVLTRDLKIEDVQYAYESNIKLYGTLTCYLCLKPIKFREDSIEHMIPISRGGTNARENLAVAHGSCNSKKNARTVEEYKLYIAKQKSLVG